MNYSRFITPLSARREPDLIRLLAGPQRPEMILFGGGHPNPAMFPFTKITMETDDGEKFQLQGRTLKEALQYQKTMGVPGLLEWLKDLQQEVHQPPRPTELMVTSGSMEGVSLAVQMALQENDPVVLESFIYPGILSMLRPFNPNFVVVDSDGDGMIPESLGLRLEEFAGAEVKPKLLYINPTGANPTGTVLPLERRREIYRLACQHDLLILEDDPYYYLQFEKVRPQSFLSLDGEGRVLRFDSFSKILSSGLRLGFVTGPEPLVRRMRLNLEVSTLHASSLSQFSALELLTRWGRKGFFQHVGKVERFYRERRDKMLLAAEKHLKGLCQWSVPRGGMFLWMKVNGVEDTWDLMMEEARNENVLAIPGKPFQPLDDNSPYIRVAFSLADTDDFDVGMARLAKVIERRLKQ